LSGSEGTPPDAERQAATERIRSLLVGLGEDSDVVDQAVAEDRVGMLLVDRILLPGPRRYTPRQVAESSGMSLADFHRFWRAFGFPDVDDDEPAFTDLDIESFSTVRGLLALNPAAVDAAVELARVIGSSMARIAEAAIAASTSLVGATDEVMMAERFAAGSDVIIPSLGSLLEYTWRRHLQEASRRTMLLNAQMAAAGAFVDVAVGFADLVGYTVLTQELSQEALSKMVGRFEKLAHDVVTSLGGRLVKMIGDEAMFVVGDVASAADIALSMSEAYAEDEVLSDVRVGLALGSVVTRDGDYYGPPVNLASRVVKIAKPGSVLVSDEVHSALESDAGFSWKQLRPRQLKDIGSVQLWSLSRSGRPPRPDLGRRYTSRARLLRPPGDRG
jgi:adenylate cyclase